MKRTDLFSPVPRERELPHGEFPYSIEEKSYLPEPDALPSVTFASVLASRESRRSFKPLSPDDLNSLLHYSARALVVASPNQSPRWQHRPTPSAGGRHPVDLLVIQPQDSSPTVRLYQPEPHALAKLKVANTQSLEKLCKLVNEVVSQEEATILWFGAQFDRTLSKYENGESLVWRDVGALLGTISFVAECLGLNSCALGITGEPFISELLASNGKVIGVGGLLVGRRSALNITNLTLSRT